MKVQRRWKESISGKVSQRSFQGVNTIVGSTQTELQLQIYDSVWTNPAIDDVGQKRPLFMTMFAFLASNSDQLTSPFASLGK